jgi:hypothetical protein
VRLLLPAAVQLFGSLFAVSVRGDLQPVQWFLLVGLPTPRRTVELAYVNGLWQPARLGPLYPTGALNPAASAHKSGPKQDLGMSGSTGLTYKPSAQSSSGRPQAGDRPGRARAQRVAQVKQQRQSQRLDPLGHALPPVHVEPFNGYERH